MEQKQALNHSDLAGTPREPWQSEDSQVSLTPSPDLRSLAAQLHRPGDRSAVRNLDFYRRAEEQLFADTGSCNPFPRPPAALARRALARETNNADKPDDIPPGIENEP